MEQHKHFDPINMKVCTFCLNQEIDKLKSLARELVNYVSAWSQFSNGEPEAKKLVSKARKMGL